MDLTAPAPTPSKPLQCVRWRKLEGKHPGLRGDCSGLWGVCSGLRGVCSGLRGVCFGLRGDCAEIPRDARPCAIKDWVETNP